MNRRLLLALMLLCCFRPSPAAAAEPPCDKYPATKQARCEKLWNQLNQESVEEISQFGLAQLKRRQDGKLSQEQHLKENMEFIKQSTDKRLKALSDRMAQEKDRAPAAPPSR